MNQKLTKVPATSITAPVLATTRTAWGKGSASASDITLRTHNAGVPEELATVQKIVGSYRASRDNT